MSYTPTTWTTGDTVTASAMNKIEQGIANAGGGGLVVDTSDTLNKSYNEIMAMLNSGIFPYLLYEVNTDAYAVVPLQTAYFEDDTYFVYFFGGIGEPIDRVYISGSADGQMVLD